MSQKIAAAMPVRAADKQAPAQYIRYAWITQFLLSSLKLHVDECVYYYIIHYSGIISRQQCLKSFISSCYREKLYFIYLPFILLFSFKDIHHHSREWLSIPGPNKGSSAWWKCRKIQWNPHDSSKYSYRTGSV